MAVLIEQTERSLLGLVATAGQVLERLATGSLLPATYNTAVLVLDQVGLGQTAGCVLGISVENRGLGANGGDIGGHLIIRAAIFLNEAKAIWVKGTQMSGVESLMQTRVNRLNLDDTKFYEKIVKTEKGTQFIYLGRFVRSYRMGSGDGMTAHWDFDNDGTLTTVDDELWGSIGGNELIGFRAVLRPQLVAPVGPSKTTH